MLSRRTLDANPHRTRNGWIPSAIIIFITIVLFFVAFCIVISLLPTYLPDKTITGITTNGQSTFLSVRYLTYADLTGKTVANTVNVGQQLSTQLGLPSSALSVQSTQFQSAATTGKRKRQFFRILSTLRERRQTSIKGTFIIIVKINFPSTVCKTTFCENNYSNKVKSKIYTVPTVPISFTFTDGTKLDINIFFQALEDVSSGTSSSATITTSTTASSNTISNSPTATPTTATDTTTAAGTTATDTTSAAGTTATATSTAAVLP
ncbi:unnamed protein product [Rotaria magnacalcarata]|uniref:Uncharacterized protein n=1 Tax=Rotaria magnacalcarata TaxID=392030 RepID=A0A817AC57_9BILA|nr:unnamed protein product [Rotaria magnacalcarata]